MTNFIGIDLGTTNSAISSYDGENVKIWKSSDGYDVTPSAIFVDKRGNKYVGKKAYNQMANDPENVAVRFKRMMGTSTMVSVPNFGREWSPEECSAEILKTMFNYLPDEIKNDPELGTVITVPAAFDQKAKDATLAAANMAGIGKVALMQEPVAAVMSIMKTRPEDGIFLVYDLGGGTLDVAVAESTNGRVSLMSHGGISVCGGRDFDRVLIEKVVYPWMQRRFKLPDEFWTLDKYKSIVGIINHATEEAKIALSDRESATISVSESQLRIQDEAGEDLYLDVEITREIYNSLTEEQIQDTIKAVLDTLNAAGLKPEDVVRIVFVGGPTNYKPLRDKVSSQLGIPANTEVNPMTAVSEGASIYAESIDWSSQAHAKKNTRGSIESKGVVNVKFDYIARTPDSKTKLVVTLDSGGRQGYEFQIDSLDTGWSSGKIALGDKTPVDVLLSKNGENTFKVFVFNDLGEIVPLETNKIVIVKTAATIDSIPASHTVFVGVLDKLGGTPVPEILVKAGDMLPKRGTIRLKAAETLKAGDMASLNFNLWEGDIVTPIDDNRPIGCFKISGTDFDDGVIPAGADIDCIYEMSDDGNIKLEVSIPCIRGSFDSANNFYSRQEGQKDYTDAAEGIIADAESTRSRADDMAEKIDDPDLDSAITKLNNAASLSSDERDPEKARAAEEQVLQAKKELAKVRKKHLKTIRQIELDKMLEVFEPLRKAASTTDISTIDNLVASAKRTIERENNEFEGYIKEIRFKIFAILWKQDWFVVARFKNLATRHQTVTDKAKFNSLIAAGNNAMEHDNIDRLRQIVGELEMICIGGSAGFEDMNITNIVRG